MSIVRRLLETPERRTVLNHVTKRTAILAANQRFKAWFGNSKVVDRNGNPLILYHGTSRDFSSFNQKRMIWGSVTPALATEYSSLRSGNPNILPIVMRIEQPFNADLGLSKTVTLDVFCNAIVEQAMDAGVDALSHREELLELLDVLRAARRREKSGPHYSRHDFWNDQYFSFGLDGMEALSRMFTILKFDGIQMIEGGELTYGAFDSKQVKSVFNTQFDPTTDHLSEQRRTVTLYHGTSRESAQRLLDHGWSPHGASRGSQQGNPRFLYLTNFPENARWYADEKRDGVVLSVTVLLDHLRVDPEDGIADTVEDELNNSHGLPGNVIATKPLPSSSFKVKE